MLTQKPQRRVLDVVISDPLMRRKLSEHSDHRVRLKVIVSELGGEKCTSRTYK